MGMTTGSSPPQPNQDPYRPWLTKPSQEKSYVQEASTTMRQWCDPGAALLQHPDILHKIQGQATEDVGMLGSQPSQCYEGTSGLWVNLSGLGRQKSRPWATALVYPLPGRLHITFYFQLYFVGNFRVFSR